MPFHLISQRVRRCLERARRCRHKRAGPEEQKSANRLGTHVSNHSSFVSQFGNYLPESDQVILKMESEALGSIQAALGFPTQKFLLDGLWMKHDLSQDHRLRRWKCQSLQAIQSDQSVCWLNWRARFKVASLSERKTGVSLHTLCWELKL